MSRQCEIAIDILIFCGRRPEKLVRTQDAATFANATRDHAHQVAVQLVQKGLLIGVRGRPGGIRLARHANDIRVGEVVRLMEPSLKDVAEPADGGLFHSIVKQAFGAAFDALDDFTIADLC